MQILIGVKKNMDLYKKYVQSFFNTKPVELRGYKRIIVLVGGSGYVGKAFLKKYREIEDVLFVVVARRATNSNGDTITIRGDITNKPEDIVKKILQITGRIDNIIYLSATYTYERPSALTRQAMLHEFDVNTIAPTLFTQEVKNQYWATFSSEENREQKRSIVVIGSQAGEGKTNREELVTYSGTKAALRVIFDYYSSHLATFGIKTIFLKPGGLQSEEALHDFIDQLNESMVS